MEYTISQVFVCLTYIMLGVTYLTTKRTCILIFSLLALFCNGVHYALLGARAGLGVVFIAGLRNVLFLIQQKIKVLDKYTIDDWIILTVLMIVLIFNAIYTYEAIYSLIPNLGAVIYTIAVWQKKVKVYKLMGIFSSICSLTYFIFIGSLFAMILESCLLIVSIVSTIVYLKNNKKSQIVNTEKEEVLS